MLQKKTGKRNAFLFRKRICPVKTLTITDRIGAAVKALQ